MMNRDELDQLCWIRAGIKLCNAVVLQEWKHPLHPLSLYTTLQYDGVMQWENLKPQHYTTKTAAQQ